MNRVIHAASMAFWFAMLQPVRDIHFRINHLINFMLAFICSCLVFAIATMVWPYNQVPKYEMHVIGSPVVGDNLHVSVTYCKIHDWLVTDLNWSLENNVRISLPTDAITLPVGCHTIPIDVATNAHIAPGMYVLRQEVRYQPWPWRTVNYVHRSQPFYLRGHE
jgi:hypothetical protein